MSVKVQNYLFVGGKLFEWEVILIVIAYPMFQIFKHAREFPIHQRKI